MTHKERETQAAHAKEISNIKARLTRSQRNYQLLKNLHDSLKTKHARLEAKHVKLLKYVEKVNKGWETIEFNNEKR